MNANRIRRTAIVRHVGIRRVNAGREEGGILVMAVVFMTMFLALGGLAFDGGRYISQMVNATTEAQQAARLGAATLTQSQMQNGALDPGPGAISAAEGYTVKVGHPGVASLSGNRVEVAVSYTVPTLLLGIVGISELHIDAHGSATDVTGF